MKKNTTILVAVGALLAGGVATATFMNNRGAEPVQVAPVTAPENVLDTRPLADTGDVAAPDAGIDVASTLQYADVVKVEPVTRKEKLYATVIGSEPVRKTTSTTVPHEVCEDVVVQERLPERDGNVGGTVAGAVIGGLLGNQVGSGNGKKAATAAGAVAGGVIGNQVDKRHVGGQVVTRTERQCHTENITSESSQVTGYNVTYRNADGTTGTMRMASKPANRIAMGDTSKVVGYNVTYRYQDSEKTIRMEQKPVSDRLPVVEGELVTQTVALEGDGGKR